MKGNIRKIRVARGMSVKDLASEVGVSAMTIYRYETGKRNPTILVAYKMATALGVTVDELIKKAG